MMSMACGLAATGKVPYCSTFAIFAAGRAYDQVRLGIAHNELKIRVGASHGGVSLGEDGASHQMIEDIALMRAMPRMTVVVPADYNQAYRATLESYERERADVHAVRPPGDADRLRGDPREPRRRRRRAARGQGHLADRHRPHGLAGDGGGGVTRARGRSGGGGSQRLDHQAASLGGDPRIARQDRRRRHRRGAPRRRRARRRGSPARRRAAPGADLRGRDGRRVRPLGHRRSLHGALRPHGPRDRRPRPRGARPEADRLAPAARPEWTGPEWTSTSANAHFPCSWAFFATLPRTLARLDGCGGPARRIAAGVEENATHGPAQDTRKTARPRRPRRAAQRGAARRRVLATAAGRGRRSSSCATPPSSTRAGTSAWSAFPSRWSAASSPSSSGPPAAASRR